MKKIFLAASALVSAVALSSAAQAADVAVPAYDWTGFYVGANAGVAWNNSDLDAGDFRYNGSRYDTLDNQIEGDQAAFTGGAMLGYNWQMDQIVLGVETDFNFLGFSDDNERNASGTFNEKAFSASHKTSFEADWFGTIRGRLGFAADNMLFYGTGGLAYGHMSAESDIDATYDGQSYSFDGNADTVNWGWTVGAGMEYGIENWSLGVEYLYVDLGSADWDVDANFDTGQNDIGADGSVDYQFSVVRATAKLRF